jgi:hypothetical protein
MSKQEYLCGGTLGFQNPNISLKQDVLQHLTLGSESTRVSDII